MGKKRQARAWNGAERKAADWIGRIGALGRDRLDGKGSERRGLARQEGMGLEWIGWERGGVGKQWIGRNGLHGSGQERRGQAGIWRGRQRKAGIGEAGKWMGPKWTGGTGTDRFGRNGWDRNGSERTGMAGSGTPRSGRQWRALAGLEWNGTDRSGWLQERQAREGNGRNGGNGWESSGSAGLI